MFKPPYWFHDNIKFPSDTINKLKIDLSKIEGNVKTSYYIDQNERPDKFLNSFYADIIENIMKNIGIFHLSKYIYTYWSQLYDKKSYHGPHNHATIVNNFRSDISWVHFIDVPEQKCFRFTDTKGNILIPNEQLSGDFICFPSWVWHEVEQLKTDYSRVVVAGNISFTSHDVLFSL